MSIHTRADNVEWHKGRDDYGAGKELHDNPYPYNTDTDSRYLRWRLGWHDGQAMRS